MANSEEYAIRKGNFKLIKSAYKNKTMLFDLEQDHQEIHDISAENPEVVDEMITLYQSWNAGLAIPRWTDPHMDNVKKEEANTRNYRRKSLSKKEQDQYE